MPLPGKGPGASFSVSQPSKGLALGQPPPQRKFRGAACLVLANFPLLRLPQAQSSPWTLICSPSLLPTGVSVDLVGIGTVHTGLCHPISPAGEQVHRGTDPDRGGWIGEWIMEVIHLQMERVSLPVVASPRDQRVSDLGFMMQRALGLGAALGLKVESSGLVAAAPRVGCPTVCSQVLVPGLC